MVHEGYRRSLIRRSLYAIFYECADGRVTVYAVFHTSRDPEKWRQRLPQLASSKGATAGVTRAPA
jgi:plasmid stabilization system protein ParE